MKTIFLIFSLIIFHLHAEQQEDIEKISEALGHLIGKNLEHPAIKLNVDCVIQGIQNEIRGKLAPMTENECLEAIARIQEKALEEEATKNLKQAEEFLSKNKTSEGIHDLESGKLQYRIEKKGEGGIVEGFHSPLIRYSGKYLDGTVFGKSEGDEVIPLDETIAGFKKGMIGMQEGEIRTLYVHPDLGYGKNGLLAPNALLTFEIEVIKVDGINHCNDSSILKTIREGTLPDLKLDREEVAR